MMDGEMDDMMMDGEVDADDRMMDGEMVDRMMDGGEVKGRELQRPRGG